MSDNKESSENLSDEIDIDEKSELQVLLERVKELEAEMYKARSEARAAWSRTRAARALLFVPIGDRRYKKEYIPHYYWNLWYRVLVFIRKLRERLPLPIYYWQVRFMYDSPDLRKQYDLMFAAHVIYDHNEVPKLFMEKFHYWLLKKRYRYELYYFKSALWEIRDGNKYYWEEYAQAYLDKWYLEPHPQLKRMYHGVSADEYEEIDEYDTAFRQGLTRSDDARYAARVRWSKQKSNSKSKTRS
jgi:hypothetical protein